MFGNASLPSRIYQYGCRPPRANTKAVEEQFSLAHQYRNRLCEIELERRKAVDETLRLIPSGTRWLALQTELDNAKATIEAAAAEIKTLHSRGATKSETKARRAALSELKKDRKAMAKVTKEAKAAAFADPATQAALTVTSEAASIAIREARSECGLYWGTYLKVEQACGSFRSGSPPRFHRWTGEGTLAVQIQKGALWSDVLAGKVRGVKVSREGTRTAKNGVTVGGGKNSGWLVHVLVSGTAKEPVYATFPATLHRPLPDDALIKWVYVTRRMVASHPKYNLCFVISRATGFTKQDLSSDGAVGVNLGWRMMPDGLRVAKWRGTDGAAGEVLVPNDRLERWRKVEDLQSIRDGHFNEAKAALQEWLKSMGNLPEWMTERTAYIHQWRSQGRLAALVIHWRSNRFDGDNEAFLLVEAWRAKDKHLWEWQEHQRKGNIAWRTNLYRNVAADLSRRYKTLIVGKINYATLSRTPDVEADDRRTIAGRTRAIAAPGHLTELLKVRFAEVEIVSAVDITQTCNVCGRLDAFDATSPVSHRCRKCGAEWDQDDNAAINLLSRGLVPQETA